MGNWNIRIKIGVNGGWDRIKVPGLPSPSQPSTSIARSKNHFPSLPKKL
jgi:hypothetical protein